MTFQPRTPAPWLKDDPPTKPRKAKPRAEDPITPTVRGLVRHRSKGLCELCGAAGTHLHHRQLRRSGDHSAANLVNLCSSCHQRVHGHIRWALDTGWVVSQYEPNPGSVPILLRNEWSRLDRDGCVSAA